MRRATLATLALLVLPGCPKKKEEPAAETPLVSTVRSALAERERKVQSYRYQGKTTQGPQVAEYSFSYRAPGKMRAELKNPAKTFAFDGKRLQEWDEATKVLTEFDLSALPRDRSAALLHQIFSPFAPEGWRSPLLGGRLSAEKKEAGGQEQVAVTARAEDVALTFLFAPPAMDFLGKQAQGGGSLKVTARHCDPALKLCFPSAVEEEMPGAPTAVTTLTGIELNGPLPPETFELALPEGGRLEKKALTPQ